jgi:hypothetical protein
MVELYLCVLSAMSQEFIQFAAMPAASSRHFQARVYKTEKPEALPGAFLKVLVRPDTSKAEIIRHLELIKSWLIAGEEVQTFHPDTFFCELEKVPRLQVIRQGRAGTPRQWRGRYPKGKPQLL